MGPKKRHADLAREPPWAVDTQIEISSGDESYSSGIAVVPVLPSVVTPSTSRAPLGLPTQSYREDVCDFGRGVGPFREEADGGDLLSGAQSVGSRISFGALHGAFGPSCYLSASRPAAVGATSGEPVAGGSITGGVGRPKRVVLRVTKRPKMAAKTRAKRARQPTSPGLVPRDPPSPDDSMSCVSDGDIHARAARTLAAAEEIKIREQGRVRAKRYREKIRSRAKAATRPPLFTGLTTVDRTARKYSAEDVDWIVKVGTCVSAGAARAPLAGVITHVSCEISRWTVDLYRWRICRYILSEEQKIWDDFLRHHARGVVLRFDETPMRLYVNGRLEGQAPAMITCIRAVSTSGEIRVRAPTLTVPTSKSASGLLGALRFDKTGVDVLCGSDRRWKFLMIISDAAASNKAVARRLIAACDKYPTLLIAYGLCWAHALSNATKASLGAFGFGQWLRFGHVLQAKPIRDLRPHCESMMTENAVEDGVGNALETRIVWTALIRFMSGSRGPFGFAAVNASLEQSVELAIKLFPAGPPCFRGGWDRAPDADIAEYVGLLRALFCKNPPMPICTRWYTVEQMAWHVMGMYSFSLLDLVFGDNLEMAYWPGEMEPAADADPAEHRAKSSARIESLRTYIYEGDFLPDMVVACISSLPRWRCALLLESDSSDGGGGSVSAALRAVLEHTRGILSSQDAVAEFFINREARHDAVRARVWRALATTVMYLAEKNSPYTTPAWRVIRGELSATDMLESLGDVRCCEDSGMAAKIRKQFASLKGAARDVAASSLEEALLACRSAYLQKGGCDNVESERGFSLCRALGLKLHHRPPKLSTLARELLLRHYLGEQRLWFDAIAHEAFGGVSQMKEALRRRPVKFNSFTAFVHAMKATPSQISPLWNRLDSTTKERWAEVARRHNAADVAEQGDAYKAIAAFADRGPLGSIDRRIPVDKEDILDKLREKDSALMRDWKRSEIRPWVAEMDRICPLDAKTGVRDLLADEVLLPGDNCLRCAQSRRSMLQTMLPLRSAVYRLFKEFDGRRVGLTVGLQWDFDEPTLWFDIVTIISKPEKILACPLEVTAIRAVDHDSLTGVQAPIAALLSLPEVFDGRSMCLMDFCERNGRGCPLYLLHTVKTGVASTEDGWVALFQGRVVVEDLSLVVPASSQAPLATAQGPPFERPSASARNDVGGMRARTRHQEMYERIFGGSPGPDDASDGDEDDAPPRPVAPPPRIFDGEDDEANLFSGATVSESEIAEQLRVGSDERADLSNRLKDVLDTSRYGIFISVTRGVVTTFWKNSEKNSHRRQYREAARALSRISGARRLRASRSSLRSVYDFETCVQRAADWQAWHASWIYGEPTSRSLSSTMPPPPSNFATLDSARRRQEEESDGSVGSSLSRRTSRASDWDTSSMSSTSTGTL